MAAIPARSDAQRDLERRQFIEAIGMTFTEAGSPRLLGRVLGWLMFAEPLQTQAQLAQALQASSGAISTTLRQLEQLGMVERVTMPGERTGYYRTVAHPWVAAFRTGIDTLRRTHQLLRRGAELFGPDDLHARHMLEEMNTYFDYMLEQMPKMLAKLERRGTRR